LLDTMRAAGDFILWRSQPTGPTLRGVLQPPATFSTWREQYSFKLGAHSLTFVLKLRLPHFQVSSIPRPPHLWILILIYNNLYMLLLLIHQQHSIPFRGPFHHIMVFSNMYVGFIVYTTYHKMISCFTSLISDAIIMPSGV
jgi:hypothetical protein